MQVTDEMVAKAAKAMKQQRRNEIETGLCRATYEDMAKLALTAALGAMWRPISEAPKDGSSILAFAAAYRDYYGVAQWAEADEDIGSVEGWFWPFAIRPTHFMPLPSPPAQEG